MFCICPLRWCHSVVFLFCLFLHLETSNKQKKIYRHSFKYTTCPSVRKVWEDSTLYTHHERYILNTPKRVFFIGAFSAALRLSPRTIRVSAGSMIPSSHSLQTRNKAQRITPQTSFIRFLENFFQVSYQVVFSLKSFYLAFEQASFFICQKV